MKNFNSPIQRRSKSENPSVLATQLAESMSLKKHRGSENTIYKLLRGQPVKIVCKGDSITWGYVYEAQTSENYPKVLGDKLKLIYGYSNITVVNSGSPGQTSAGGVTNFDTDVISHTPDLAIIMFGLNDANQGITIEAYKDNLRTMVEKCKNNNIEVILCSPNMMSKQTQNNERYTVADYREAAKVVAKETNVGFVDIYGEMEKLLASNAITMNVIQDTVHFRAEWYYLLADILLHEKLAVNSYNSVKTGDVIGVRSANVITNASTNQVDRLTTGFNLTLDKAIPNQYARFVVYNNKPKTQLNLIQYKDSGSGQISVTNNGLVVATLDGYISSARYNLESKICDLTTGINIIEFNSNNITVAAKKFYLSAFRIAEKVDSVSYDNYTISATTTFNVEQLKPYSHMLRLSSTEALTSAMAQASIFTGLDSMYLLNNKKLIFELDYKGVSGSGFSWFGLKDGTTVIQGYLLLVFGDKVRLYQGTSLLFTYTATIDVAKSNKFRVEHNYDGVINVYMNDALIITQTNTAVNSGNLGLYLSGSAGSCEIKNIYHGFI